MEGGTLAFGAIEPSFAVVVLNYLFTNSQTYTCAVVVGFVVQALKHLEDGGAVLFRDTNTVIGYRKGIVI